jgi:uncharacterized protein
MGRRGRLHGPKSPDGQDLRPCLGAAPAGDTFIVTCPPVGEDLSPQQCLAYLAPGGVGRVAVSAAALPAIYTVFFAVDHGHVVLRVPTDRRLWAALNGAVVAFSADNVVAGRPEGWSVLVQGVAQAVTDPTELAGLRRSTLMSWSDLPSAGNFVRISIENLSGSRLVPVGGHRGGDVCVPA